MKTYEIEVEYRKTYTVKAKNAAEANDKLWDKIRQDEFALGVDGEYSECEDEPITCPVCDGSGVDPESLLDAYEAPSCSHCDGDCEVTPEEYHDDESEYR